MIYNSERTEEKCGLIDVTKHTYKAGQKEKIFVTEALYSEVLCPLESEIQEGYTYEKRLKHLIFVYTVSRTGEDVFSFTVTNMMEKGKKFVQVITRVKANEKEESLILALESER